MNVREIIARKEAIEDELANVLLPLESLLRELVDGTIESTSIDGDKLIVGYGYSCMGCYDYSSEWIPISIIEGPNPRETYIEYKQNKRRLEEQKNIKAVEQNERKKLAELKAKYGE